MRAGTGFAVAYNPEYLRAATAFDDFLRPPMVTVGLFENDQKTAETLHRLYRPFGAPISFLGVEEAEFQKYVHNLFNATKISFVNEMRGIAHGCGLTRVDELFQITAVTAEGLRNPRYGIDDRGPYGGGCLPKDVSAWLAEMERLGIESPMASAARTVNIRMGGR
ncbi:hypothetical protein [Actinomadura luteofluorescens]|uniref:hypothetical protein n=1 Tax=Actinomadura luteofluorescens TaxID=46163 RepID=UPI003D91BA9C